MRYREVESYAAEKPQEVDTKSSKTKVYIRRNIREVKNTEDSGKHWLMEEAQITIEEYQVMKSAVYTDLRARLDAQSEAQEAVLLGQEVSDETAALMMLNQMDIIATQEAMDETLAEILLSTL
ncbi:MAG: hypothetical protein IJ274_05445 [Lachnospiraceae bacterium]|nr:hypothetical protein [Lachnospiraceae bacterium]